MAIDIKSPREIDLMRTVCRLAAETLVLVGEKIRVGMTTDDINRIVHEDTLRQGARPAPLNYHGFPKSVCTCVNDVVCHGIPDETVLKNGDIVNVDVTHVYEGFHGDTSATFYIGTPSPQARHVVEVARRALDARHRGGEGRRAPRRHRRGDPGIRRGPGLQRRARLRRPRHRPQVPRSPAGEALRKARHGRSHPRRDDLHHRADGEPRRLGGRRRSDRQVDRPDGRRLALRAVRAHGPRHARRLRDPHRPVESRSAAART